MLKKLFMTLCLALVICFILTSCGAGAIATSDAADTLYSLGLFQGVGLDNNGEPVFELDRAPTRAEAITMLVRLLGATGSSISPLTTLLPHMPTKTMWVALQVR